MSGERLQEHPERQVNLRTPQEDTTMRLMVTSFGIEQALSSTSDGDSIFHGMPPVSFRSVNEAFMPDFELLVLCDQIVMDGSSFDRLVDSPARAYSGVADTFRALRDEGRIELVDFPHLLRSNADLLEKMLDHDMRTLDQWVVPLRESLTMWRHFAGMSMALWRDERQELHGASADHGAGEAAMRSHALVHEIAHLMHRAHGEASYLTFAVEEALDSAEKRKRREYRQPLREVLRAYLAYVNANLVLSNELNIGFHDWLDFTPFYSMKFLSVGKREDPAREGRDQVEKLFTVAFPDLAIGDTSALLKALNDRRIIDLRQLISDAVLGKVEFDEGFAASVLAEVLRSERRAGRARRVLGYLTLPIGFIPWIGTPAQKVIEEAVGTSMEGKIKREHQWFYMLSEIADSSTGGQGRTDS